VKEYNHFVDRKEFRKVVKLPKGKWYLADARALDHSILAVFLNVEGLNWDDFVKELNRIWGMKTKELLELV